MMLFAGFFCAIVMAYFAPSIKFLLCIAIISIIVSVGLYLTRKRTALQILAGCTAGILVITTFAICFHAKKFPEALWQKKIPVTFKIISAPKFEKYRTTFIAEIAELGIQARLSWYGFGHSLRRGESWQATVKLKPVHGFANPGSWDYERYNMQQGISAQGYIDNKAAAEMLHYERPYSHIQHIRDNIKTKILNNLGEKNTMPLLLALAVGDRQLMSQRHWQVLQTTGTAHLMAISGLHVGLVFSVFYLLLYPFSRLVAIWQHNIPAKIFCFILATLLTGLYVLISGMAISTLRAYLMLFIVCCFIYCYKSANIFFSLLLTACLILLFKPLAGMETGFILSFSCVLIIVCLVKGRFISENKILAGCKLQWKLTLLIIPLTLASMNTMAIMTPVANMVAIPWVSFIIVPLLLLFDVLALLQLAFANSILQLAEILMSALWWFLQQLDHLSYKPDTFIAMPWQWLALLCMFFVPRALLPIFFLVVVFPITPTPKSGEAWLTVLDVGQGLASVLQTKNHTLVYDTGRLDGNTALVPYLQSRGIKQVDKLIISHADADHRNGAIDLLAMLPVSKVLVGEPITQLATQTACQQGQQWQWDGVLFEVVHPDDNPRWRGNNRSCVLRIKTKHHQLLLTGDIQKPVESHLINTAKESLLSDIIVVPHHGSKTSSNLQFLQVVNPQHAIVPAGFLSQYGHPHQDVLANYEAIASQLYYTAHQGAIHVKILDTGLKITAYRDRYKRWWH